jgi:hypothetical protein
MSAQQFPRSIHELLIQQYATQQAQAPQSKKITKDETITLQTIVEKKPKAKIVYDFIKLHIDELNQRDE